MINPLRIILAVGAAMSLSGCLAVSATEVVMPTGAIQRTYASAVAPYARTIIIPPGYETIRLPGIVADPLTPGGATYGDTEAQTASVLGKIAATLESVGASEADVVAMTVYLVGVPEQQGALDFQGMMRAYGKRYGSPDQANRPVRSTVQVAGLVGPGMLVEIEVTAARNPR